MRRKEKTESARVSPFDLSPCVCRRARMTWCRVYLSGSRAGICQQLHTHVYRIIPPIYFASSSSELNSWRMYLDIKRTHAGGRRLTGNRNCISIELRLEEMLLGLLHFPPVVWLFCWVMRSIRQRKIRDNNHNMDHWVWQGIIRKREEIETKSKKAHDWEREKEGVTSFFFSLGLAYFEEIKGWALIGPFGIHLSLSLHLHPMAQCNPFRFSRSGIIFLFFSTLFEKRL